MANVAVYDIANKQVGDIELNDNIFGVEMNAGLLHQAVIMQLAAQRLGTHATKTRGFVRGGGRKPWKQKGTGRARSGSTRSPLWVGGGTVFGPHPRKYNLKMNRKVRQLALRSALSDKFQHSNLTLIANLAFDEIKTKKAVALLDAFGFDRKTLFVADASEDFDNAYVSMRNIPNAMLVTVAALNVYDIVNADKLVFTEAAAAKAGEVFA